MTVQLQTIGILVENMGKTLHFYRTLGLPIPEGVDDEDTVEFEAPNGITLGFLSLAMAKQSDPNFKPPTGDSMNLQFCCDAPAEVDRIYQTLMEAGYTSYAEPWDAFWGQRFARITDPDGRIVNLYAPL